MTIKTQGIVLNNIKFADNKRIISIFTKSSGKKSFLVYNSKQKKYNTNYFQPLSILNLEFFGKANQNLLNIKEASIFIPFTTVHTSIAKSSIVFFLTEIINKLIDNDFIDEPLFDYILNSLIFFDNSTEIANFHLAFMTDLMHYFGIMPQLNYSEKLKYFDIANGIFTDNYDKDLCFDKLQSAKFFQLCRTGLIHSSEIVLTKDERQMLISKIISYYSYHYKQISDLKSPAVLTYLF